MYTFQLERMKAEIEAVLMRHLKRGEEHIPVSKNVNWNHCYKDVAALLTLVQWETSQHHAQHTIVSAHRCSPGKR